jgi:hypothetical protein
VKRSQARRSRRVRDVSAATGEQRASESCAQPRSDRSATAGSRRSTARPSTLTRMQFHSTSERSRVSPDKCHSPGTARRMQGSDDNLLQEQDSM